MAADQDVVRAAGGLVWRDRGPVREVLIVHRVQYDDWSFPKGKLDPGETWEQAARREVHEETGIVARLGAELASTDYIDHKGRPKRARYWEMTVVSDDGFEPGDEISARAWVAVDELAERLTYERDVEVLESLVAVLG